MYIGGCKLVVCLWFASCGMWVWVVSCCVLVEISTTRSNRSIFFCVCGLNGKHVGLYVFRKRIELMLVVLVWLYVLLSGVVGWRHFGMIVKIQSISLY
jgi:hypothetical protein